MGRKLVLLFEINALWIVPIINRDRPPFILAQGVKQGTSVGPWRRHAGSLGVRLEKKSEKIVEERLIKRTALGVVLDGEPERPIRQAHLLDDAVGRAP